MSTRKANAKWLGTLKDGNGVMKYGDVEGPFTYASRFEEGKGTNPEELVGWLFFYVSIRINQQRESDTNQY